MTYEPVSTRLEVEGLEKMKSTGGLERFHLEEKKETCGRVELCSDHGPRAFPFVWNVPLSNRDS